VAAVAVGSRNTHYRAARYGPTQTGLPPVGLRQLFLFLFVGAFGNFGDDIAREDARPPAVRENFATQLLICRSRGFVDEVILQSHQLFKDRHAA
jgi:hypothetical protein